MDGKKYDSGKPMYSLIDPNFLEEFAKVLTFGASKYEIDNWKKVPNAKQRYLDALIRHIEAYRKGETIDLDSGLNHLAHAACNLMFLFWADQHLEKK